MRTVKEHPKHFEVDDGDGKPAFKVAKQGLSPHVMAKIQKMCSGGVMKGYADGGVVKTKPAKVLPESTQLADLGGDVHPAMTVGKGVSDLWTPAMKAVLGGVQRFADGGDVLDPATGQPIATANGIDPSTGQEIGHRAGIPDELRSEEMPMPSPMPLNGGQDISTPPSRDDSGPPKFDPSMLKAVVQPEPQAGPEQPKWMTSAATKVPDNTAIDLKATPTEAPTAVGANSKSLADKSAEAMKQPAVPQLLEGEMPKVEHTELPKYAKVGESAAQKQAFREQQEAAGDAAVREAALHKTNADTMAATAASGETLDKLYNDQINKVNARVTQMSEDIANNKIDPNRLWTNSSTGAKVASAIGLLLGGLGAGAAGGRNMAIEAMDKAIDHDIDAQVKDVDNKKSVVGYYMRQGESLQQAKNSAKLDLYAAAKNTLAQNAEASAGTAGATNAENAKAALTLQEQAIVQNQAQLNAQRDHETAMQQALMNKSEKDQNYANAVAYKTKLETTNARERLNYGRGTQEDADLIGAKNTVQLPNGKLGLGKTAPLSEKYATKMAEIEPAVAAIHDLRQIRERSTAGMNLDKGDRMQVAAFRAQLGPLVSKAFGASERPNGITQALLDKNISDDVWMQRYGKAVDDALSKGFGNIERGYRNQFVVNGFGPEKNPGMGKE